MHAHCDPKIFVPGPVRIAVATLLSFFQSVQKLFIKIKRTVRAQLQEKDDFLGIASPTSSHNIT